MSAFDDEVVLAYVDGELEAARAAELEAAMDADPVLAERVARHAALRSLSARAFSGVLEEPVPERLTATASAPHPAPVRRPRFGAPRGFGLPQWAAMAACLAVGVLVGRGMVDSGPVTSAVGGLQARGALAEALDDQLAAGAGPIEVGLSFRNSEQAYCRTFRMDREALAGVACREAGGWAVRMTAAATGRPSGDYRMAASATPPEVLAYVDQVIAGEPLDRQQEIAARKAGWR